MCTMPPGIAAMLKARQQASQLGLNCLHCATGDRTYVRLRVPQAEFKFEFVTPPGVAALTNAREVGEPAAAPGGLVRHTYERTPAMSTYLVAVRLLSVELI